MKDKPRKYTIDIDGKSIEKTAEELPSEVVIACEKINNLMQDIGRLNSQMKDASILRAYYLKNIVEPAFLEKES
tara:strand:+ start:2079 stop:2300 length:222 start_codon:yes stop_codon:yes gene_type:complete